MLLSLAGCGGEVRQSEPAPVETGTGGQGTAGQPNNGSGLSGGNVPLPACALGFKEAEDSSKSCDFVVDGLCYESKIEACACACPPNKPNTRCTSGFPVADGHVLVTCQ